MKYSILLLGFLFLLTSTTSVACSCDGDDPFMTVCRKAKFVALVKVISYNWRMQAMDVEVIDIYRGTESHKKITIWGDNGVLCRPYVSTFKDSSYFVVALFEGNQKSGNVGEAASDYAISICDHYWLTVNYERRTASGQITKRKKEIRLEKLKAKLTSG